MQYLLIVSPVEFNEATKLPVILPITNGGKFARRYTGATASRLRPTADYPECQQILDIWRSFPRPVSAVGWAH